MTVEKFDPSNPKQTTTMDTPKKVIEEQHNQDLSDGVEFELGHRIGFISLGCRAI